MKNFVGLIFFFFFFTRNEADLSGKGPAHLPSGIHPGLQGRVGNKKGLQLGEQIWDPHNDSAAARSPAFDFPDEKDR